MRIRSTLVAAALLVAAVPGVAAGTAGASGRPGTTAPHDVTTINGEVPPGRVMVNLNSGTIPFVAIDTFVLRRGEQPMAVVEPGQAHVEQEYGR